jgi:hypothetical protein
MNLAVNRNELKYYVSYQDYKLLSRKLAIVMKKDPNGPENGYLVRSLYFDNFENKAFDEKNAGINDRRKFRLRIYGKDDKHVKCEIKNKSYNQIFKETAVIDWKDALQVQNQNYDVLRKYNNPILNKMYYEFTKEKYLPVVVIDYIREAYLYDVNNIRITFDKCLKSNASNLQLFEDIAMAPLLNENVVILEIKYNNFLPEHIKKTLQLSRFERCAISKYCIGRMRHEGGI